MTVDSAQLRDASEPPAQARGVQPRGATCAARIRRIALIVMLVELLVVGIGSAVFGRSLVSGLRSEPEIGLDLGLEPAPHSP